MSRMFECGQPHHNFSLFWEKFGWRWIGVHTIDTQMKKREKLNQRKYFHMVRFITEFCLVD